MWGGRRVQAQMGAPTPQPSATKDQFLTSEPSLPGPSSQAMLRHPRVASLHAWDLTPRLQNPRVTHNPAPQPMSGTAPRARTFL